MSQFDNIRDKAEKYGQQHPDQVKKAEEAGESKLGLGQQDQGGQGGPQDQYGQGQQDQQDQYGQGQQGQQDEYGQGQQDQDQYGDDQRSGN
jgi:hypothetical protein